MMVFNKEFLIKTLYIRRQLADNNQVDSKNPSEWCSETATVSRPAALSLGHPSNFELRIQMKLAHLTR